MTVAPFHILKTSLKGIRPTRESLFPRFFHRQIRKSPLFFQRSSAPPVAVPRTAQSVLCACAVTGRTGPPAGHPHRPEKSHGRRSVFHEPKRAGEKEGMKTTAPSRVRPHFSSGICLVTQEEKKGNKCEKMLSLTDSGFEQESSSPETMMDLDQSQVAPMSRTHQYRKVMKPLLERKRRARMNKSLDALKDLMVNVLQKEGESITKLEKAEILELTVKHIQKLRKENALEVRPSAAARNAYDGRFKAGFEHCAKEVSKFMTEVSGVDVRISSR